MLMATFNRLKSNEVVGSRCCSQLVRQPCILRGVVARCGRQSNATKADHKFAILKKHFFLLNQAEALKMPTRCRGTISLSASMLGFLALDSFLTGKALRQLHVVLIFKKTKLKHLIVLRQCLLFLPFNCFSVFSSWMYLTERLTGFYRQRTRVSTILLQLCSTAVTRPRPVVKSVEC